jgi:hypothetical protein
MVAATGGKRKPYEPPLRSLQVRHSPVVVPVIAVAREIQPSQLALLRTAQALAFPLQEATTNPGATMNRPYESDRLPWIPILLPWIPILRWRGKYYRLPGWHWTGHGTGRSRLWPAYNNYNKAFR